MNRVVDTNGNAMTITTASILAVKLTGTPDYHGYPKVIAYTSNGAQQPNRFVRFIYETRPDVQRTFIGGSEVKTAVRLANVQTLVGNVECDSSANIARLRDKRGDEPFAADLHHTVSLGRATATPMAPATFTYVAGASAFAGKKSWLGSGAFSKRRMEQPKNVTSPTSMETVFSTSSG